jgi:hypothetical protein
MEARVEYGSFRERPRLTVVTDGAATYSALPHEIMRDTSLSRDARLLYAILQSYWWQGGECWASHATLAAEMGCKERMLRYYIRELVEAGKITERRRGHGQAKAYSPVDSTSQPARDCQLNRQGDAASGANRQEIAGQAATDCQFKRQPVADRRIRIEEDTYSSKKTESNAANAAPAPIEEKPQVKAESRATRLPADWSLTDAHLEAAAKRGFDAARATAEGEKFCDYHRAKGSRMVDWLAAWRTWLGNAVTFDARRSPAPQRNGTAPASSSSLREQTRQHSKWSDEYWDRTMGGAAMRGRPRDKEQPDGR